MSVSRLYLHGLPGSAIELDLLPDRPDDILIMDRNGYDSFTAMSHDLDRYSGGQKLHLIGFSLGAHAALRMAAAAPDKVARLTLVSALAPQELGRFLPDMAGARLFRLARWPLMFRMFAFVQRVLARKAPARLADQVIRNAARADQLLFANATRREVLKRNVSAGLDDNFSVYHREIRAYMRPWADRLARVRCPVTLWHGTGDTYAPPAMAEALSAALPNRAEINWVQGGAHFSTLTSRAAEIFAR